MKTIILIGSNIDPQLKKISKELSAIHKSHVILDKFSLRDSFSIKHISNNTSAIINLGNHNIETDKIQSIWNLGSVEIKLHKKLSKKLLPFVYSEWTEGIISLWYALSINWVNHPDSINQSSNKLKQLQNAESVKLMTPKTIITNNPTQFLEFYKECNQNLIVKTLNGSRKLPKEKCIYTTKITKRDLGHIHNLKYTPCIFQEYIPKKIEYRITIIGDNMHIAGIHSQRSRRTQHDWRNYDNFEKTSYFKSVLPIDIEKKLSKLLKVMRLQFATVDMILTPDDRYVFLDINSSGKWLWIEKLTGMPISKDIAHFLSTEKN